MKKDILCPECNDVKDFRNMIQFDEKDMEILGIVYAIRCKKCDTVFVPEMRFSHKAGKKLMKEIFEDMRKSFGG